MLNERPKAPDSPPWRRGRTPREIRRRRRRIGTSLLPGHCQLALGDLKRQLAAEGEVLQGGKKGIQLSQRNLLSCYDPFNGAYLCRKLSLLTQRRQRNQKFPNLVQMKVRDTDPFYSSIRLNFDRRQSQCGTQKFRFYQVVSRFY